MTEKSFVSMERRVCVVCGADYDTGSLLLDRRLRSNLTQYTTTGWGLCPEHQRLFDDGFVALVECDPAKSGHPLAGGRLQPHQAHRTGRLAHLNRDAFARIFNVPIEPTLPCVFVDLGVIDQLEHMIVS